MLKQRVLWWLLAALVVLVALSVAQRVTHRRAVSRPVQALLSDQTLDLTAITRITLGWGPDSTAVVIERLPDHWVVRTSYSYPASQQRIDDLLRNLGDLRGEFRSDKAEVLADYGLAGDGAVAITVFGQDFQPQLRLLVGRKPLGSVGEFVRRRDSSAVYLSSVSLLSPLGLWNGPARPKSSHFVDLQAYKGERNDIESLVIDDGGKITELVKVFPPPPPAPAVADTGQATPPPAQDRSIYEWRLKRPREAAALKTKVDAILNSASTVRAIDVADPDGDPLAYGLWKARRKIDLGLRDGTSVTLFFGAARAEAGDQPAGIYMRTSLDNSVWVVRESVVNAIFVKPEELRTP